MDSDLTQAKADISGLQTTVSSQKTEINKKADGSTVSQMQTDISNLQQTDKDITASVASTNSKIDSMKVGGRNLAAISTSIDGHRLVEGYTYDGYSDPGFRLSAKIACVEGDEFTVSTNAAGTLSFAWCDSSDSVFSRPTGHYNAAVGYK